MKTIEQLKKGDLFIIPEKKTVYVFDGYNRSTRKYSSYKFEDVNHFREFKKGMVINIDFDF